ncbi:MAG: rhomboid family intramembrane serine protease [Anaerolineaceae bacterium]
MEPTENNLPDRENPEQVPSGNPNPLRRIRIELGAKTPWVTYLLMGVCILIYLLQMLSTALLHGDLPLALGAKINESIYAGQYWRLLTPALLHGSITHILFNMYALYVIGRSIEQYYGHGRFALLFWLSAFSGNVFSFLFSDGVSVGASTAIFGIIAAQAVFIYRNWKFFRNPRALLMNTLLIIGINLVLGLSPGIDNWGHLGGLLGGLVFAWTAGATWKLRPEMGELVVSDENTTMRVWLGGLAVILLFGAPLVLQLFFLR